MRRIAIAAVLAGLAAPALADPLPTRVGQCAMAKVKQVETRLQDGSGQPVADFGQRDRILQRRLSGLRPAGSEFDASRRGDPVVSA